MKKKKVNFWNSKYFIKDSNNQKVQNEGITLIALVVTLVVLLLLAGISITVLFGDSGIIKTAQEAGNKWNAETQKEQTEMQNLANEWNDLQNGNGINPETAKWTQDKTSVTNGTVTLEVGRVVTGYVVNGIGDGSWCVLGAKDGKLLITTNRNQGTVTLEGQEGYANGVSKLNTEGAKFNDGNMAELVRSIDVEDINRVTGYDPDEVKYNSGNNVGQWKNEVTYTFNSDGKIHYQGTKYPKIDTTSEYTSFTYWNGSKWLPLASGESKKIIHNYYYYYPQTLSTTSSNETQINGSTSAYTLLFANTSSGTSSYYWLSSQYVYTSNGVCGFGLLHVSNGRVYGYDFCKSYGNMHSYSYGIRPVVSLKSNIKVTEEGALSM